MGDWGPAVSDEDLRQMGLLASDPHEGPADIAEEFPDIVELFRHYDALYFENKVATFTTVEWSGPQMTSCGGVCMYMPDGGGCRIRLSAPLLKFRPVKDLKMVLLHEMIHAYMCLEGIRDSDDHGPKFRAKMNEINSSRVPDYHRPPEGYNITVYHTMHDEVKHYLVHWWECSKCKDTIKRSKNRRPQPADCRGRMGRGDDCKDPQCHYHQHLRNCGGEYTKVKGPDLDAAANAAAPGAQDSSAGAAGRGGRRGSRGKGRGAGRALGEGGAVGGRGIDSYLVPRSSPSVNGKADKPDPLHTEAVIELDAGDDALIPLAKAALPPATLSKEAGASSKARSKVPASFPAPPPGAGTASAPLKSNGEQQPPAKRQKLKDASGSMGLLGPAVGTAGVPQESRDDLPKGTERAQKPAHAAAEQMPLQGCLVQGQHRQQQQQQHPRDTGGLQQPGPGPGAGLRDLCAQAALRRAGGQQGFSAQMPLEGGQLDSSGVQPLQQTTMAPKPQGLQRRSTGPAAAKADTEAIEVIVLDSQD